MTKNILLVEYDEPTIHAIKGLFYPPVFELAIASDGETAKQLLKNKSFDLMITAAMLPRFHGFNLALAVSQEHPDMKIIIISAIYKGLEYRHQAITQYRANDFFEKPLDKEKFKKRVLTLLDFSEDDLLISSPAVATQIPMFDTARIPAPNFADDEENKLSSADIFGDIIEKIEKIPEYEIDLGGSAKVTTKKMETRKPDPGKIPVAKPGFDLDSLKAASKPTPPAPSGVFRAVDQKIGASLDGLRTQQVKSEIPTDQMRKIEDEIARKFEDTISGLGLRKKPAPPPKPVVPPPPKPVVPQPKPVVIPEINAVPRPEVPPPPPPPPPEKPFVAGMRDELIDEVIDLGEEVVKKPEPAAPRTPEKNELYKVVKKTDEITMAKDRDAKPEKKAVPYENPNEVGDYVLLGLIARGGMAEIYKAKKKGVKGFEKVIAIKKIISGYGEDDKYIEMLVDEAKIAAELSHPNIVQIYDLGRKDNYYFIAMEYVLGKDLREIQARLRERDKWFPEEIAIFLTLKILEALNYAHKAKDSRGRSLDIVHRDVSPPNILISYNGDVKLTDFGVSKASIKLHQTLSGALKGKLLYMSPEQACGESTIDYRSDLYSAGVVLFELLTGKKLFLDTSEMTVLKKVQNGEIINPRDINPDIDPVLEKIILTSLNKDCDKRYQSAAAMIADLEAYVHKKYDRAPGPLHLSHFIYDLFENDIHREGIKVDLKPLPYIPKVRESAKPQPVPEKPTPVVAAPVAPVPEKPKPVVAAPVAPAPRIPVPEFEDTTNINLDEEKPAKAEKMPDAAEKSVFNPESLFRELDKEKKKFPLLPVAAVLLIGTIAASLFFLTSSRKHAVKAKPEVKEQQTGAIGGQAETHNTEMKKITDQLVTTQKLLDEAKLKQEEELKKLQDEEENKKLQDERRKKAETDRIKKEEADRLKLEEEQLKKEEEERLKLEEENRQKQEEQERAQRAEAERRKAEEAARAEMNRVKEGDIVSLNEVDVQPVVVSTPAPNIPASVRAGMPGNATVMFTLLIDQNGKVETARLLRQSQNARLDSILTDLVKTWKYRPATKNNVRVKVWKTVQISVKK